MNSIIKNKKTIIICAIVLVLIAWWVWAYFHFSKAEDTDTNVAIKDLTEEEICQDQYWINATNWDSWHCKCKEWFERTADWTKCVMIKEDDLLEETEDKATTRLTLEQKRAKAAAEKANRKVKLISEGAFMWYPEFDVDYWSSYKWTRICKDENGILF